MKKNYIIILVMSVCLLSACGNVNSNSVDAGKETKENKEEINIEKSTVQDNSIAEINSSQENEVNEEEKNISENPLVIEEYSSEQEKEETTNEEHITLNEEHKDYNDSGNVVDDLVPNVIGMTYEQAKDTLNSYGYFCEIKKAEPDRAGAIGEITAQETDGKMVYVSSTAGIEVPNLYGLNSQEVKGTINSLLNPYGFSVNNTGCSTIYVSEGTGLYGGYVVSQSIPAGQYITSVQFATDNIFKNLNISYGIIMPNFIGCTQNEATAIFKNNNAVWDITRNSESYANWANRENAKIKSQSYAQGSKLIISSSYENVDKLIFDFSD